jgi:hypothetical protein
MFTEVYTLWNYLLHAVSPLFPLSFFISTYSLQHFHSMSLSHGRIVFRISQFQNSASISAVLKVSIAFLSPSRQIPGWYLKLGQECFVQHHSSLSYSILLLPNDRHILSCRHFFKGTIIRNFCWNPQILFSSQTAARNRRTKPQLNGYWTTDGLLLSILLSCCMLICLYWARTCRLYTLSVT